MSQIHGLMGQLNMLLYGTSSNLQTQDCFTHCNLQRNFISPLILGRIQDMCAIYAQKMMQKQQNCYAVEDVHHRCQFLGFSSYFEHLPTHIISKVRKIQ